jgi:hypothetical protein
LCSCANLLLVVLAVVILSYKFLTLRMSSEFTVIDCELIYLL